MIPVVLLHGWGMRPDVFDGLRARLGNQRELHTVALPGYAGRPACEPYTIDTLARSVAAQAPVRCHVVGWSLGALVALEWARRATAQVADLALLGATPCFVERDDWPCAMARPVFDRFVAGVRNDTGATLWRFAALQAFGEPDVKAATQRLRANVSDVSDVPPPILMHGLDVLARTDLRAALPDIGQPALVVHGDRDALVPLAAAEYLGRTLPRARLSVMSGAAHAPFVSREAEVARGLLDFFDD